jgi:AcrR family transcriptional regulator
MVSTIHCGDNEAKLNGILDAAQKRFGLYGLAKTTMQEIATDLGASKGSLYYYFPDKEHLYAAVVEKEQNVFLQIVNEKVIKHESPCEMLREYLSIRQHLFRSYLNLSRFRLAEYGEIKPLMDNLSSSFSKKERVIIKKIFEKGISLNLFYIDNPEKMAILYLTLLRGLFHMKVKSKDILYLDKEEFSSLVKDSNVFTDVFLRGLQFKEAKSH